MIKYSIFLSVAFINNIYIRKLSKNFQIFDLTSQSEVIHIESITSITSNFKLYSENRRKCRKWRKCMKIWKISKIYNSIKIFHICLENFVESK